MTICIRDNSNIKNPGPWIIAGIRIILISEETEIKTPLGKHQKTYFLMVLPLRGGGKGSAITQEKKTFSNLFSRRPLSSRGEIKALMSRPLKKRTFLRLPLVTSLFQGAEEGRGSSMINCPAFRSV